MLKVDVAINFTTSNQAEDAVLIKSRIEPLLSQLQDNADPGSLIARVIVVEVKNEVVLRGLYDPNTRTINPE